MHSSLIGKVHKAHQYAQEPERIRFERFEATIHGENDDHRVTYDQGKWTCTCHFFGGWGLCAHTMAIEQFLGATVPVKQTFVDLAHDPAVTIGAGGRVD